MPVLTYASELWGYGESASIERIILKFTKYILEVPFNTSNSAVLGEWGLYPVWVSTKLKPVRFWNRICEGNASVLVEDALILSCSLASSGKYSWFKNLSAVVEDTGLLVKDIELDSSLLGDLPKNLRNLFLSRWELDLSRQGSKSGSGGNVLRTYNVYKHSFDMEPYLGCRKSLRSSLTTFASRRLYL